MTTRTQLQQFIDNLIDVNKNSLYESGHDLLKIVLPLLETARQIDPDKLADCEYCHGSGVIRRDEDPQNERDCSACGNLGIVENK